MAEPWSNDEVITTTALAAMPWGVMGYVNGSTSDQSGISAVADITSLSVAFTAISTRLYKTTVHVVVQQLTSTGVVKLFITDGAGAAAVQRDVTLVANDEATLIACAIETGGSGALTRKARISTTAGTVTVLGTSTRLSHITVEDIGAA